MPSTLALKCTVSPGCGDTGVHSAVMRAVPGEVLVLVVDDGVDGLPVADGEDDVAVEEPDGASAAASPSPPTEAGPEHPATRSSASKAPARTEWAAGTGQACPECI